MFKKSSSSKYLLVFFVISIIFALLWHIPKNLFKKDENFNYVDNAKTTVHFIDVGQGDCELIICDGVSVLIDAGEKFKGSTVVKYLKSCGVKKLNYVIASHAHTDHIGGLLSVLDYFEVDKIIMPKVSKSLIPTNSIYRSFLERIKNKKISVEKAKRGDSFNLGEGKLKIIGPIREDYEKLNDTSVGALFSYNGINFLFCGDMEREAEQDVLNSGQNIKADVFKLNHHGSKTSNTNQFIAAIKPRFCVLEAGKNNSYGHPHIKVLNTLKENGVKKLFRTDQNGNIMFYVENKKLYYKVDKEEKSWS